MLTSDVLLRKLREVQYFHRQMNAVVGEPIGDAEEFGFLLSALLSAGRSITDALENRRYGKWFTRWQTGRASSDATLLEFMRTQRNAEVHREGVDTDSRLHLVPMSEIRAADRSHPAYGFHVFAPQDLVPTSVGVTVYWFDLGGTQVEAVDACRRFVAVLGELVDAFGEAHPGE